MGRKGKKKFKDTWANQTDLGEYFGISPIGISNELKKLNLKDQNGHATQYALDEGIAIVSPLKDGRYFCMWNKCKVLQLLSKNHRVLSEEERVINKAIDYKKQIDREFESGNDKVACIMADCFFDDIPIQYREKVRTLIGGDVYD